MIDEADQTPDVSPPGEAPVQVIGDGRVGHGSQVSVEQVATPGAPPPRRAPSVVEVRAIGAFAGTTYPGLPEPSSGRTTSVSPRTACTRTGAPRSTVTARSASSARHSSPCIRT